MSVKFGLLGILARQAKHGYDLKRAFEQATGGIWRVNTGQIYQSLDALAADGLVSFTVEPHDNAPDRKVYEVTDRGRQALEGWLENAEARVRPLRDELFVRLAVMTERPTSEALDLLHAYRRRYAQHMRELTRAKRSMSEPTAGKEPAGWDATVESLLLEAAIYHCDADLRWLDHCEAVLVAARGGEAN